MKPDTIMLVLRERGLFPEILKRLNIKRQAIDAWRVVPADRVIDIAEISGLEPWMIRPDIFPDPSGQRTPLEGRRTRKAQRVLDLREKRRRSRKAG
jgi:hypothetical protein